MYKRRTYEYCIVNSECVCKHIAQDLRCHNNLRGGLRKLFTAIHPNRLSALLCVRMIYRLQQLSLFIRRQDHLAAFALNAERAVKVFDRLTLSPRATRPTDARVFYVPLCQHALWWCLFCHECRTFSGLLE